MGFFDLFKADFLNVATINQEVDNLRNIPNAILLDVRTKEEYDEGHIPGAVNIPVEEFGNIEERIPNRKAPVYIYCKWGSRSKTAAQIMNKLGYTNVRSIGAISTYKGPLE